MLLAERYTFNYLMGGELWPESSSFLPENSAMIPFNTPINKGFKMNQSIAKTSRIPTPFNSIFFFLFILPTER